MSTARRTSGRPQAQDAPLARAETTVHQVAAGSQAVPVRHDAIHGDARPGSIDERSIRNGLDRILASPEFKSAPQLRAMLRFVVTAAIETPGEKIKGYTVAVEALGRDTSFNPATDPIVRVEAARLRRRLDAYYRGTGLEDAVRIVVPKGNYTPVFINAEAEECLLKTSALAPAMDLAQKGQTGEAPAQQDQTPNWPEPPKASDIAIRTDGDIGTLRTSAEPPPLNPGEEDRSRQNVLAAGLQAALAAKIPAPIVVLLCILLLSIGYALNS